jgi:hypothetical protein
MADACGQDYGQPGMPAKCQEQMRAKIISNQEKMTAGQEELWATISDNQKQMRAKTKATIHDGQEETKAVISEIQSVQTEFEETINKTSGRPL